MLAHLPDSPSVWSGLLEGQQTGPKRGSQNDSGHRGAAGWAQGDHRRQPTPPPCPAPPGRFPGRLHGKGSGATMQPGDNNPETTGKTAFVTAPAGHGSYTRMACSACRHVLFTLFLACFRRQRILLPMQEPQVPSLDREDPLEKEVATHSSNLAW